MYYCHHVSQMGLGSYAEMQCFPFSTDDASKLNLKSSVTGSSTYKALLKQPSVSST